MVVGLGCEKFTVDMLLDQADIYTGKCDYSPGIRKDFDAMVDALMKMADKKLAILNQRKRVTLPLFKALYRNAVRWQRCILRRYSESFSRLCSRYACKRRSNGSVFRGDRGS